MTRNVEDNRIIYEAIDDLLRKGGALVGTQDCHQIEIAQARACNRMYILSDGCGIIRRTKGWLKKHDQQKQSA